MGVGYTTLLYDEASLETGVGDVAACRYDGIEIGLSKLRAAGPEAVGRWLGTYDLDLYCVMSQWIESGAAAERVAGAAPMVADLGAEFLGILPPRRHRHDRADVEGWLAAICEAAVDAGLVPLLHHHGGTVAERPAEIDRFLGAHGALRLLFDTAHWYPYGAAFPEGDVTDAVERFGDAIAYVHLKDVAPPSSFAATRDGLSGPAPDLDTVIDYFRAFTDIGEGILDFAGCLDALDGAGYDGHYTIEIENETEAPLVHAKRNVDAWRALRGA